MRTAMLLSNLIVLAIVLAAGSVGTAQAQPSGADPYSLRRAMGASDSYTWEGGSRQGAVRQAPAVAAPVPSHQGPAPLDAHAQSVLNYYGSQKARATMSQMPGRPSSGSAGHAVASRPASKPFSTISRPATVSPYLNLYLDEGEDAAPNYHVFVRPQQQQVEQAQSQQVLLQRLQRQVQQAAYSAPSGGAPQGSYSRAARFNDTGRYYSGLRR
ncbi:hypothetical protein Mal64_19010 [Pseudobythopirellula maris]|uniref:Uncharacterized protein n=1 Tax=Pseudobythopirellula maris TaxID=2527991 RepID=A0A5C5ZMM6_9BACT|nr:hypothetical protein [Pseudobythopirellula maris]TWT88420.1 hypothetical protein Mal64_19010 [Pseudobythopirellula maris]